MTNTTLIAHIFNEEYLLPFWLQHHKPLFDNGIIIDYRSTDRSVQICKELCPHWTVITSKNQCFDAQLVDDEVMEIESNIDGIKVSLNVTEFLFNHKPIKELFADYSQEISFNIKCYGAYTDNIDENPQKLIEIYNILTSIDTKYHFDRGCRTIHTFKNGSYTCGRHSTQHPSQDTNFLNIIWFGYYPWNNNTIKRKLQIKQNIPESNRLSGAGFQHFYSLEQMLNMKKEKFISGLPLSFTNEDLYNDVYKHMNPHLLYQ